MSRLIEIDPQIQPELEPEGYEFGCYMFDELPNLEITNIESTLNSITNIKTRDVSGNSFQGFSISDNILQKLQEDVFCKIILNQFEKGNISDGQLYLVKDKILKRYVLEGDNTYETTVVPRALTAQILKMAHDELGHNSTHRTYTILKRLYYWKGLKPSVVKHIKMCYQCQRRNKQVVKYATFHFDVATFPMQFISMDLIGEFHPPTSRKHRYALTVICMLTCYVFSVPLKTKTAEEVKQAYIDNVYSKFGGSLKMLSDNGTELKNKMFEQVSKELGFEYKLYTQPYHPASNGRIEGFHAFLKACIAKHVAPQLEWDVLIPLACAAYNFIPNEHSKESPFFLMFGRDPVLPLNTLLGPKMRYLGNDINILSLEAMKNMFEIAGTNLKVARERGDSENNPLLTKLQPGDTVLVQNHTKGPFDPKYVGNYQVFAIKGNQIEVRPSIGGPTEMKHVKHVKYIFPADRYIKQIPDYSAFGRKTTLRLNPDRIPDLHWNLTHSYHTTNIGLVDSSTMLMSTNCVDVGTLSYAKGDGCKEWCGTTLNTDVNVLQSNRKPIVCHGINSNEDNYEN